MDNKLTVDVVASLDTETLNEIAAVLGGLLDRVENPRQLVPGPNTYRKDTVVQFGSPETALSRACDEHNRLLTLDALRTRAEALLGKVEHIQVRVAHYGEDRG